MKNRGVKWILWLVVAVAILVVGCNVAVVVYAGGKTFDNVDDVPQREYGLLLGSTPMTRYGNKNYFFKYRIDAAERLYRSGKVNRIISVVIVAAYMNVMRW